MDEKGVEDRKRLIEWLAFHNPYANGEATYFVAEDDGKIVGHVGSMPQQFVINGEKRKGYYMHDLYVHPQYREQGLGFFINLGMHKELEKQADSFCCGLRTTKLNLQLQRQRKYFEMRADVYVKMLRPMALIKILKKRPLVLALSPFVKIALFLANAIALPLNRKRLPVIEVTGFDERFDRLSEALIGKIHISTYKTADYLNWKYVDRPYSQNKIFATERDGEVSGFIVLAPVLDVGYRRGTVLDLVADPDDTDTVQTLARAAVDFYKDEQADSIHCYMTDKRFVRPFKKLLFINDRVGVPVMLANLKKAESEKELLTDVNNWHINYGESDGFMLSP